MQNMPWGNAFVSDVAKIIGKGLVALGLVIIMILSLYYLAVTVADKQQHTHQYGKWEIVVGVYSTYQRRQCTNCGWTISANIGH